MPNDVLSDADVGIGPELSDLDVGLAKPIDLSKSYAKPGQLDAQGNKPYAGYLSAGPFSPYNSENMQEAVNLYKSLGDPAIAIPRIRGTSTLGKLAAAPVNVAAGLAEGFESPLGLAATAVGGPVVKGLFAGLAAKEAGRALGEVSVTKDPQQLAEGVLGAGLAPYMALHGTFGRGPEIRSTSEPVSPVIADQRLPMEPTISQEVEQSIQEPSEQDQIKGTSGVPVEQQSVTPDRPTEVQAQEGTARRSSESVNPLPQPAEVPQEITPPSAPTPGVRQQVPSDVAAKGEGVADPSPAPAISEGGTPQPVPQPDVAPQPVTEPTIQGMGGEVYGAFEQSPQTPTGIRNAIVDQERAQRGLPPAVQPARRSFGEVWDRAMALIDRDPQVTDNLLDELSKKPRALTDTEDAILLQRQIDLQNEYGKATRDLAQAFADGRTDAVEAEKLRVAGLSDRLLDLYNIGKKVGTETGRGLNARRMMAYEDFSLAKMELDMRGARGGAPLTDSERSQVQELHDKINATQKAYDDYVAKTNARISEMESKAEHETMVKEKRPKTAFDSLNPADQAKATVKAITDKVKEGKPDDIAFYVQRIARSLVASGVKDREVLIDRVHAILKEAIPDITRRQTMDAISGYGDYKQLSKDAITIQLRGMKGEMQQLAKLEDMAAGQPPLKSGVERRTPTDVERQLIKEVNDAKNKFQVPVQDPETQLKSALDTLKTTLRNRIADYEDRLTKGDFAKRPRREVVLDSEASRLKAENERVKKQFQRQVALERWKQRGNIERAGDWISKWRRGFLLSGPVTLAKLTSAAAQRAIFTPAEELTGGAYSALFPEVAKRAAREGNLNVGAEAKAITESMTKGFKDAWDVLRTGQSDLDVLYGKESLTSPTAIDFFGHIHGALKSTTKRAEFTRSLEKRTASAIRNGVDASDPMVQSRLVIDAYKDANRSIFLQDNKVVDAYKAALQALERKDKSTGKPTATGKALSTTARVLLPIVKVPTNIVGETLTHAFGTITGGARLAAAYAKGVENLRPEEADLILRNLKKGSLGAAVMLIGFFNPQVIGGYYQPGQKRPASDVKAGNVKLYGVNIPSFLLHNPLLETLQIGATIRRVADSKLHKHDPNQQGVPSGLLAAGLGLAEEVPFVKETTDWAKALQPSERSKFFGELTKSLVIPQGVQWLAQHQDRNAKGDVIKRDPKTVLENLKTGIPYLRQTVKPKRKQ